MRSVLFLLLITAFFAAFNASTYSWDYNTYLRFHWKGALTSHSIIMKIFPYLDQLQQNAYNVFLALYTKDTNGLLANPKLIPISFTQAEYPVTEIPIDSLTPNTQYFYTFLFTQESTIENNKFSQYYSPDSLQEFNFTTLDIALKPSNFIFGASSCAQTGSTSPVFQNLQDENFDFFIQMGDLHYNDIDKDDATLFYEAYYTIFASEPQKLFYQSTPICYVWDDHDFGVNDADGNSPSKPAVTTAYKSFVPYYPLKNYLPTDDSTIFPIQAPQAVTDPQYYLNYTRDPTYGIFRSFIVGRCLFIVMDLRSFMDVIPGDILGEEQTNWLENQLIFAGKTNDIKMVFLVSSVAWIDEDKGAVWGPYKDTKKWLAGLIKEHIYDKQKKLIMIAGDAHMIAFDDGSNNEDGGFPIIQASSLDRRPSCKGGPYSHGFSLKKGQYGVIQVTDIDDEICVKVDLKLLGVSQIAYDTCHPELYPVSDTMHCPPAVWVYITNLETSTYIMIICALVVVLVAVSIFCYRHYQKKRESKLESKERYSLAFSLQELHPKKETSQQDKMNESLNESESS